MAKDPYYENYLKQAVITAPKPVAVYFKDGKPDTALYIISGNKTMCLPIADVERKRRELGAGSERGNE